MNRTPPRVSVVIPALNEERYLPLLLEDLSRQTLPVHEVIVADAGSTDATARVARAAGARIVRGGHPAEGRNEGARGATGDWLLFLDADVRLPENAVEVALSEMARERLDSASSWFAPDAPSRFMRVHHWMTAWYFRVSSKLGWPHSIGAFLLLPRAVHEKMGGFDTTIRVAEDQDYVRRLARMGRYGFLRKPSVVIAARRFEKEGALATSLKWLGIELHRLCIGEIRGGYFRYFK